MPFGVSSLTGFEWLTPCLRPEDIVYIGLRDVESSERAVLKGLGIKLFTMFDVDRLGIGNVLDEAIDFIGEDHNIHLSFDILTRAIRSLLPQLAPGIR